MMLDWSKESQMGIEILYIMLGYKSSTIYILTVLHTFTCPDQYYK